MGNVYSPPYVSPTHVITRITMTALLSRYPGTLVAPISWVGITWRGIKLSWACP